MFWAKFLILFFQGTDHLTATWKVTDSILQHIDIREEGKGNAFSLGKSLWIQNEVSAITAQLVDTESSK